VRLRVSLWFAPKIGAMDGQFSPAGMGVPWQLSLNRRLTGNCPRFCSREPHLVVHSLSQLDSSLWKKPISSAGGCYGGFSSWIFAPAHSFGVFRAHNSFQRSPREGRKDAGSRTATGYLLSADSSEKLEAGRVVACFRVDAERWKSLGGAQLDLDLAPPRVMGFIARAVSHDVLVAQLRANLRGDVR